MSNPRPIPGDSETPRNVVVALVAITVLGLVLRIYGVTSDLWMDEIATMGASRGLGAATLLRTYNSPNQHVLNSILLNYCISLFGETEWSVRLPALLFGAATVPAMYWLARCARFSRIMSLGAALLLALSYHHLEFSQNARGYTAYVFFSLITTCCLVRMIERPRTGLAVWYVVAMALNFLALLPSAFVFAAHVLVAAIYLFLAKRSNDVIPGRTKAIAITFGATAAFAAIIYLPMVTTILGVLNKSYVAGQPSAFKPLSVSFFSETINGIAAGIGGGLLIAAIPLMVIGTIGMWLLFRRAWVVTTSIIVSQCLFFGTTVVLGWSIYPRFFILALPLGFLAILSSFEFVGRLAERWGPPRFATSGAGIAYTFVGLLTLAFIAVLPRYYRTPKQPNRVAAQDIGQRIGPDGVAVALWTADAGFKYYAPRLGLPPDRALSTRSIAGFDSITAKYPHKNIYLLTSSQRMLEIEQPAIAAAAKAGWERSRVYPASVRGNELTIWVPKP